MMKIEERYTEVSDRLDAIEKRVALLEAQMNPPEPDPLEVGTEVFRQTTKVKNAALKRR